MPNSPEYSENNDELEFKHDWKLENEQEFDLENGANLAAEWNKEKARHAGRISGEDHQSNEHDSSPDKLDIEIHISQPLSNQEKAWIVGTSLEQARAVLEGFNRDDS